MKLRRSKAIRQYGFQSAVATRRAEDARGDDARAYKSGVGCEFEVDDDPFVSA